MEYGIPALICFLTGRVLSRGRIVPVIAAAWLVCTASLTLAMDIPVPRPKPNFQPINDIAPPEPSFFKIATGSTGGTYFPIGEALAAIISHPTGSERCEQEALCGPRGMQAVTQFSNGSVRNIRAVNAGEVASGLAQADLVGAAYKGQGIFVQEGAYDNLRAIANLYQESVHLIVASQSDITSVADLNGKSLSIDRKGSGTNANARIILKAFNVSLVALELVELDPLEAADLVSNGDLDAFFFVGGAPVTIVKELISSGAARLLPIDGPGMEAARNNLIGFEQTLLQASTYGTPNDVPTLSIGALWIVNSNVSQDRIYQITRALWQAENRDILLESHILGEQINLARAVTGLPIPLHSGAAQYYEGLTLMGETSEAPAEITPLDVEPANQGESGSADKNTDAEITTN